MGVIVGIDRFLSEARALTNFAGNAVATVLIGSWVGEFDRVEARRVLSGADPFDEPTMLDAQPDEPRPQEQVPVGASAWPIARPAPPSDPRPAALPVVLRWPGRGANRGSPARRCVLLSG